MSVEETGGTYGVWRRQCLKASARVYFRKSVTAGDPKVRVTRMTALVDVEFGIVRRIDNV